MFLAPHIEEDRLDVGAGCHGLDNRGGFAVRALMRNRRREPARVFPGKVLKEQHRKISRLRLWSSGVVLLPLSHLVRMLPGPRVDIRAVRGIRVYPCRCQLIVSVGPLGDDMRLSAELVPLEPGFNIRRHRLALLRSVAIRDNRAERAGHPIAQSVVGGGQVGWCRRRSIVGGRRRARPEVLVLGEWLRDQDRSDRIAMGIAHEAAVGLKREKYLSYYP